MVTKRVAFLAAVLVLVACASRPARRAGQERGQRERVTRERGARQGTSIIGGREVVVWPPTTGPAPQPVVIFSHGFGGCATQSKFLTEAIASHGYWVIAPNHKDARCARNGRVGVRTEEPLRNPELWTDATYADRGEDIRAIVRALADSAGISQSMDLHRLALVGHSLGGYTVLGVAGAWESWKMPGVTAVLALSPYAQPFTVHATLRNLSSPVMFQGGTLDIGITPFLRRPGGAYDATPAPKHYVEFTGAGHFAWTDLSTTAHAQILNYSLAFLDRYLGGLSDEALKQTISGVSDLRYAP